MVEPILMALAGIGGVAALLSPPQALPSEADFKKAKDKLTSTPDDPDANTVAGKYTAFVLGDFPNGMDFLSRSGDKTLRTLAEHEKAPLYTDGDSKKVTMADEWVTAAKAYPALTRIFYDRSGYWLAQAWPGLKNEPVWGDQIKARALKLSAARPPGSPKKNIPSGWKAEMGSPVLDGTIAHTGSYSAKFPSEAKSEVFIKSDAIPVSKNKIDYSAFVRSDGTYDLTDQLLLNWFNKGGQFIGDTGVTIPIDVPFWNFISGTAQAPPEAAYVKLVVALRSKKGTVWADDLSLKVDGKEQIKNGSFEGN